jgi:hypothetical protein
MKRILLVCVGVFLLMLQGTGRAAQPRETPTATPQIAQICVGTHIITQLVKVAECPDYAELRAEVAGLRAEVAETQHECGLPAGQVVLLLVLAASGPLTAVLSRRRNG